MNIAVVTGASSGMGKQFAKKIDELKLDEIWAIALEAELLEALHSELKTKVRTFALDLTKDESFEIYKSALDENKPNVMWLVNASGFGKFGKHSDIALASSKGMIDLNCTALVKMTELTIPFMQSGARIVEFGSVAGFQPVPYIATYAASKAFVINYSRAIGRELKQQKISVTTICPFWTKTKFFDRAVDPRNKVIKNYVVMYEPEKVIEKAFKDSIKRKKTSIYGFIAKTQTMLVKLLPYTWTMGVWMNQQKLK